MVTSAGARVLLESNHGLFASKNFKEAGRAPLQAYSAYKGKDNAEHVTVEQVFPEMIYDGELYRADLNKVSFILNAYEDYLQARQRFPILRSVLGVEQANKLSLVILV